MAIERNTKGLAEAMFGELDALIAGESSPQVARAKSALANTIISVKRLEMDFSMNAPDGGSIPPVHLGL